MAQVLRGKEGMFAWAWWTRSLPTLCARDVRSEPALGTASNQGQCFQMNGVMFLLVAKMSCSPGQKETKKKSVL